MYVCMYITVYVNIFVYIICILVSPSPSATSKCAKEQSLHWAILRRIIATKYRAIKV